MKNTNEYFSNVLHLLPLKFRLTEQIEIFENKQGRIIFIY